MLYHLSYRSPPGIEPPEIPGPAIVTRTTGQTGFEPVTVALTGRHSTVELLATKVQYRPQKLPRMDSNHHLLVQSQAGCLYPTGHSWSAGYSLVNDHFPTTVCHGAHRSRPGHGRRFIRATKNPRQTVSVWRGICFRRLRLVVLVRRRSSSRWPAPSDHLGQRLVSSFACMLFRPSWKLAG